MQLRKTGQIQVLTKQPRLLSSIHPVHDMRLVCMKRHIVPHARQNPLRPARKKELRPLQQVPPHKTLCFLRDPTGPPVLVHLLHLTPADLHFNVGRHALHVPLLFLVHSLDLLVLDTNSLAIN